MSIFKELGKVVLALVLVAAGFIGVVTGLDHFSTLPLRDFCSSLGAGSTPASVLVAAREHSFVTVDLVATHSLISVLNHKAPYFRYECRVTFNNGRLTGARFGVAD